MRILAICDHVEPILYSGGIVDRIGDVDLILSCGDLPAYYIEYIVSMLNRPCYFVFGNHGYGANPQSNERITYGPGGALNLHLRTARYEQFRSDRSRSDNQVQAGTDTCDEETPHLLLAGLEGSMRYNTSAPFQYTDSEMWWNIVRLIPGLLFNRIRYGRWLDILVAHSPPLGIHDESDLAHTGFRSFLAFMRYFKPQYLLHGHIHLYRRDTVTVTRYDRTDVINVYPFRLLEIEAGD